jgi:hypothetical protein
MKLRSDLVRQHISVDHLVGSVAGHHFISEMQQPSSKVQTHGNTWLLVTGL